jgi:protein-S-isoprenylcysteine O-methyltransferase Ste14
MPVVQLAPAAIRCPNSVVAGPYRYVRNPLYVANILMYTAMGLFYGFIWLAVFIFAFSVTQYVFIVAYEEQTLLQLFGELLLALYSECVARWFP